MLRDYHVDNNAWNFQFFRLFKLFDKALVCFFDKTWWNGAHQNTFSLSSLFYYSKYNRDHCECEIS